VKRYGKWENALLHRGSQNKQKRIIGFQNITRSCITGNDVIGMQVTGSDVGHVTGSDVTGRDVILWKIWRKSKLNSENIWKIWK
jgi:hypothetical protein